MITKTSNPNDAIDLFEIELHARAMRAQATRDMARSLRAWIAARFGGTPVVGGHPARG